MNKKWAIVLSLPSKKKAGVFPHGFLRVLCGLCGEKFMRFL
jgi:hypothetical protein